MKISIRKGFGFGLTSGIITTLGLIMGLYSATAEKNIVLGGILIIALADALSDALGVHVSEESESKNTTKQIWESTLATFISKLVVALTFIIPVLLFDLTTAVWLSVCWGLSLIVFFSYFISRKQGPKSSAYVIFEHLIIAVFVLIATYYIGQWINGIFQ